ncbi:activator of HSP90 ATPase [Chitinophaga cymbidii]|uniref:Activator of HSP90 ATPase n=2 Tax=Chitinophaga cymbidii TaxID=1096750 RepID=A0A512RQT6_9BACT|nr:activator of HSP90 ATPase [Chitinophaga cymbidii]
MIMKSIYHRLLIEAPAQKVYDAITTQQGLAGWWTPATTAKPEVDSINRFEFEDGYYKEMKVEELHPASRVEWICIQGFEDWIGTTITFELQPHKKGTVLLFHHDGFKEYDEGYASCSYDWATFLRSLRALVVTGKGHPFPNHHDLL